MFTATRLQAATYLLGVCLFSISFLVFLNSSVSFVITDLIRQKQGVGNAVGTLGFADELVALVACPLWGVLSDRVGVRTVSLDSSGNAEKLLTRDKGLCIRLCDRRFSFASLCTSKKCIPSTAPCQTVF